jgi:hypothetical protein
MRRVGAVFPIVCSTYERWRFSVEVIQLDDEYLTKAGFLGDGESLNHCARLPLTYCPLVGAFESVKQTIETTKANPKLLGGESLSFLPHLSHLPLCV